MRKTMIMAILFTVGALGAFATLSANAAISVSAVSASSRLTNNHGPDKATDGIIDTENNNMWHSAQGDGEFFALREVQVFPDLKPNVTGNGKQ